MRSHDVLSHDENLSHWVTCGVMMNYVRKATGMVQCFHAPPWSKDSRNWEKVHLKMQNLKLDAITQNHQKTVVWEQTKNVHSIEFFDFAIFWIFKTIKYGHFTRETLCGGKSSAVRYLTRGNLAFFSSRKSINLFQYRAYGGNLT